MYNDMICLKASKPVSRVICRFVSALAAPFLVLREQAHPDLGKDFLGGKRPQVERRQLQRI